MSHGEECILIHTYHVNDDYEIQPRCPVCYDAIYEQPDKFDCDRCLGTGFDGGIKAIYRAWGQFTDAQDEEDIGKRGRWHPSERAFHTEHIPDLWQRDFVVRVSQWTVDHRVVDVEGIYVCKEVQNESLRTGNQPGQTELNNIGQRAQLQSLARLMPIYSFPLVGQRFERFDRMPR